jgi:hypothetical protein
MRLCEIDTAAQAFLQLLESAARMSQCEIVQLASLGCDERELHIGPAAQAC